MSERTANSEQLTANSKTIGCVTILAVCCGLSAVFSPPREDTE